ncbi:MAG: hypothetical protein L6W00_00735 [Lentisphaeria bacterium]|nr:MAG: hypothetical protein L6W00_00735 [Lentisphaeria bacterium]
MSAVKFFILTSTQYAAIDPKDDGTLYFVSDQNRIYKGTVPYSHPIELVDEFPATGLVGTLYVNTSTKEGKAWNGSAWVTVQLAVSTTLDDSDEAIPTSKAVKEYVDGAVENIVAGGGAVTDVTYADKTITVKKGRIPRRRFSSPGWSTVHHMTGQAGNSRSRRTVELPLKSISLSSSFSPQPPTMRKPTSSPSP